MTLQESASEPTALPLNKFNETGPWDAIVVGSGMGGMACAAALAKYGRKVLVLEQHYVAGGFTHTFSRKGYTWDVGVHCVGEMSEKEIPGKLVRWLSDGDVKFEPMGETYEKFYFPDGFEIEFPSTSKGFKETLKKAFPNDGASIDAYFNAVYEVVKSAKPFFAFRALPEWLGQAGSKLLRAGGMKDYWTTTTHDVLEKIVPNPRLRAVLCAQWGYYGSTPKNSSFAIHALTARHFINGGYYPAGGAKTIADSFLRTVKEAGGTAVVRASVREILFEGDRAVGVRMEDGREFRAPIVVSAAGAQTTARALLPEQHRADEWATEITRLKQSPAYVCMYFGLEGDVRAAGATNANQWFFETWDMEHSAWNIEDLNALAPVLYVSFPSLKDSEHVPGPTQRHTMEAVTFVPWEVFDKWKHTRRGMREKDYMEFKKSLESRILAQLGRHAPELLKLVKHYELSTPLSTLHFTRAPQGAIYGLAPTPQRFASRSLRTRTPFKGLYMAGGDVATLGVTGALVGGVLAASTIEPRVFSKLIV